MQGQNHVFQYYASGEENAYAKERCYNETRRLYDVMNSHLKNRDYLADEYSIAEIACWLWINSHSWAGIEVTGFEELHCWYEKRKDRPAVQRGILISEINKK